MNSPQKSAENEIGENVQNNLSIILNHYGSVGGRDDVRPPIAAFSFVSFRFPLRLFATSFIFAKRSHFPRLIQRQFLASYRLALAGVIQLPRTAIADTEARPSADRRERGNGVAGTRAFPNGVWERGWRGREFLTFNS